MRKAVNKKLVANLLTVASDLIAKYWKSDVTLSAKEWKCKSGYFLLMSKLTAIQKYHLCHSQTWQKFYLCWSSNVRYYKSQAVENVYFQVLEMY